MNVSKQDDNHVVVSDDNGAGLRIFNAGGFPPEAIERVLRLTAFNEVSGINELAAVFAIFFTQVQPL